MGVGGPMLICGVRAHDPSVCTASRALCHPSPTGKGVRGAKPACFSALKIAEGAMGPCVFPV